MKKLISFMHISIDGFVAGPNGEMDWIAFDETLFDYIGQRIRRENTAMYGRVTHQMMENYWPTAGDKPTATKHDKEHSKWYNQAQKIVLSKTIHETDLGLTTVISDNLSDRIHELKQQDGEEILLFGSPTATHSLMQWDLIDGFWLFVNPMILGQGIPLFTDIRHRTKLKLSPVTRQFDCGVTELNYTVDR